MLPRTKKNRDYHLKCGTRFDFSSAKLAFFIYIRA